MATTEDLKAIDEALAAPKPRPEWDNGDVRIYADDDWNPEEPRSHNVLVVSVLGSDYYFQTVNEDALRGGPIVRIRTSGNAKLAVRSLFSKKA